jgi:hypothetical protein
MNEFSIRKKLPSANISKELIQQLEKYLLKDIPTILQIDSAIIKEKYIIEITDELGTETLKSIYDYSLNKFHDGTKEITLGFQIFNPEELRIFIYLSVDDFASKLVLSFKSPKPREKANGIYNGILDHLKTHTNYNYLFHNPSINGIVSGVGIILVAPISYFLRKQDITLALYFSILAIFLFLIGSKVDKIKPYSEFDTNKQRNYNRVFNWFLGGLLSFIVFGLFFGKLIPK